MKMIRVPDRPQVRKVPAKGRKRLLAAQEVLQVRAKRRGSRSTQRINGKETI